MIDTPSWKYGFAVIIVCIDVYNNIYIYTQRVYKSDKFNEHMARECKKKIAETCRRSNFRTAIGGT